MSDIELTITCAPFNAKLTETGCQANLERALSTARKISNGGPDTVFGLREKDLEILAGCSRCERCNGKLDGVLKEAIAEGVTLLADVILEESYTTDSEEQRLKRIEAYSRWNRKPEVKEYKREWRKKATSD